MRRLALILALSAGLAAPALADTIDVLKQNTLMLHEANGRSYTLLISDGGAMEQVNSAGTWASGNWAIEERGFCWTARGAARLCIPLPADKAVGDSWEVTGPTGRVVWTAEIVAGRAELGAAPANQPEEGHSGQ
jgi:hypothetical protein